MKSIELIISKLKPPIFWKDKPILLNNQKNGMQKIKKSFRKTYDS